MDASYLAATRFIDWEHPAVEVFANQYGKGRSQKEQAVALYYAVRDSIAYDPYHLILDANAISASLTLQRQSGYCIEKSLLLAAAARANGIPSRLGFSIVRNHLASEKFVALLLSDKFVFHGYNEFFLEGRWVKCTPAFNRSLCEKFNTQPLDWDGESDSIFQEFHGDGRAYMEYLHEYGTFDDLPVDLFFSELRHHYPHLFTQGNTMLS
ncbi:MAG: transglutaminase family protein [Chitinophagales bacterium]